MIGTVIALAAALAALVAAGITYGQLRQSRFSLGVDLALKLEEKFDGMQVARAQAARALKYKSDATDVEPVLDFFETLGLLVRRGAIDCEVAWLLFSHWVLRYAALAADQIKARRELESDPTYYAEFDYLVGRFNETDKKKRSLEAPPSYSDEQLARFLDEEGDEEPTLDGH